MIHIFVNNFFCVACIIFALTIFKGNDLLYNLMVSTKRRNAGTWNAGTLERGMLFFTFSCYLSIF